MPAYLIDSRCNQVAGGTFHSFANLVLREFGRRIDLSPSFTIMDRPDSEDAIQLLRTEMGLNYKDRRFPRKQTVAEIFSMSLNKQTTVADLLEREYPHLYDSLEDLLRLYERYVDYKKTKSLLDYDDLLTKLRDLLVQSGTRYAAASLTFIDLSWSMSTRTPIICRRRSFACWRQPMTT